MLKILPPNISNLIAAGEVVQRPSSVVKELLENAIDAGAGSVSVIIEDAGKTLIQVIDDGCGMTPEEARLCFEAVAEVTLRTRRKGSETGTETVFTPSGLVSQEEAAMPEGTNIAVRNIFYSLPARRKFLKSDNTELRQIIAEFSHVALCRPDVGVRLSHNGKDIYNLRRANTLKQRILEIEGKDMGKELIDVSTSTRIIEISGFVGNPQDARRSAGNQYFFVNGRYFRSPYFHKAVMKAYDKLIPEGTYPSYYLFFSTPPENVDVNIHPSKTEVKFENETEIFELLTAVVREALGRGSFIPTIDFDHDTLPDIPAPSQFHYSKGGGGSFGGGRSVSGKKVDYGAILPETVDFHRHRSTAFATETLSPAEPDVAGYGHIFEDSGTAGSGAGVLQISSRYIATPMRSGLLIVDVRRARERIFYERYLRQLDDSSPISHQVLFPCGVTLPPERYHLLMEDPGRLRQLGFDIEPAGDFTISVKGLPEGFGTDEEAVRKAVDDIVAALMDAGPEGLGKAAAREEMARKLARAAVSGTDTRISGDEARLLVDTLFSCAEPEISPAGRRCMFILTEQDIERHL